MFKKFRSKFKKEIDAITGFLFIALVFYMLYFSLWVFCPCQYMKDSKIILFLVWLTMFIALYFPLYHLFSWMGL